MAGITCTLCPSYGTEAEVLETFGRDAGVPVCLRFGYALNRPGLSEIGTQRLCETFALNCDAFGKERPAKPEAFNTRVVNPDWSVVTETADPEYRADEITTCRACTRCVDRGAVHRELGFPLDLCRGKGKLIFRPQFEARGCSMAQAGEMASTTEGLELREEYREGFVVPVALSVKKVTEQGNVTQEPSTYVSDAYVSEVDAAKGIRAWRAVENKRTGKVRYAPIFKREFFTPEEQALIPQTGDRFHPELYVDYSGLLYRFTVDVVVKSQTLALEGPPGVGKTEGARYLAWLCQVPFYQFSYDEDTDKGELIGTKEFDPVRGTYFRPGRLPKALGRPSVCVHDELNTAEDVIRQMLRPVFAHSRSITLDASMGEIVALDEFAFQIIAQNPSHDFRNIGTKQMASADMDRLTVKKVPLPTEAIERSIIMRWCELDGFELPESQLSQLINISADIREASTQNRVPFTWGVRQTVKVGRLLEDYDMIEAFDAAILDFHEDGVAETVYKFIRDHTGLEK